MTVTLTQTDPTAPPVTVEVDGLPEVALPAVVTGIVQRSTDGVIYRTVRGLSEAALDGDELPTTPDWEFKPGVVNTYRAGLAQEVCDTFTRTVSDGWGNADTGQTWDTSAAGAAADVAAGVATVTHASATTAYPAYLPADDIGDVDLGVSAATNLGGTPGGSTVAVQLIARRVGSSSYRAGLTIATDGAVTLSASWPGDGATTATPLTYTGAETYRLRMRVDGHRIRAKAWDPAATPEPDWQLDETVPGGSRVTAGQIGVSTARAAGNTDAGLVWALDDLVADTGRPTFLSGQTATITPGLVGHWLCSTMRSFLNRRVSIKSYSEPTRTSRGASSPIVGRTLPIGQVELSSGRAWPLVLRAYALAEARAIEYTVASGDVLWLLCPAGSPIPGGYYRVEGQATGLHGRPQGDARWLTLPLVEVAAPSADIATAQSTWDTVIATYGTWPDVVSAQATWEDLLTLVGDPDEVVVDQ